MKMTPIRGLAALVVAAGLATPFAATAEPVRYVIDHEHAMVSFLVDRLGFSRQLGFFSETSGEIVFDAENPANSSVVAVMQTGSVVTNLAPRDEWLRGEAMLDAANHPEITFRSTGIEVTGENTGLITGDITIRGETRPVVLDAVFNRAGTNPINQKETIGFSATTRLARSDFGVSAFLGPIGDTLDIRIDIEGIRAE